MGSKAEVLLHLRSLPFITHLTPKDEGLQLPGTPVKIPKGGVVEFSGSSPAELIVEFLAANSQLKVFWCEENQRIFPPYIAQRGYPVSKIMFGTYGSDLSNGVSDLLRNKIYDVVIAPNEFSEIALNRFGKLARDSRSIFLMIAKAEASRSTHIDIQIEVHRGCRVGEFKYEILKIKHGRV